ncbi:MAG: methyltransferase domain-containing protein [Gemmatimonadaceae bacterium]|nr:methyltransferase domain-containing protein [Gemmatimonadaceae bacterium]MBA3657053.1 methyltransferase domain-containing protein [Gemmatimonadaceae bacterium]
MGISVDGARHLLQTVQKLGISGKGGAVLTLGRQATYIDLKDFGVLLSAAGIGRFENRTIRFFKAADQERFERIIQSNRGFGHPPSFNPAHISDELWFAALGFDVVDSVDANNHEGASFLHDLNLPGLAEAAGKKYDFIFDGGTLEHVFHVPNVLDNLFSCLNIGGWIYHQAPSNNHVDHGFYQFSPTFFHDWYGANRWKIGHSTFFRHTKRHNSEPWHFYPYSPGSLAEVAFGGMDEAMWGVAFCAQKTQESTSTEIPQQSLMVDAWHHSVTKPTTEDFSTWHRRATRTTGGSITRFLKRKLRNRVTLAIKASLYSGFRRT